MARRIQSFDVTDTTDAELSILTTTPPQGIPIAANNAIRVTTLLLRYLDASTFGITTTDLDVLLEQLLDDTTDIHTQFRYAYGYVQKRGTRKRYGAYAQLKSWLQQHGRVCDDEGRGYESDYEERGGPGNIREMEEGGSGDHGEEKKRNVDLEQPPTPDPLPPTPTSESDSEQERRARVRVATTHDTIDTTRHLALRPIYASDTDVDEPERTSHLASRSIYAADSDADPDESGPSRGSPEMERKYDEHGTPPPPTATETTALAALATTAGAPTEGDDHASPTPAPPIGSPSPTRTGPRIKPITGTATLPTSEQKKGDGDRDGEGDGGGEGDTQSVSSEEY
jgi:hypothetical protein